MRTYQNKEREYCVKTLFLCFMIKEAKQVSSTYLLCTKGPTIKKSYLVFHFCLILEINSERTQAVKAIISLVQEIYQHVRPPVF